MNKWAIPTNIQKPVETVYELENKEENFQIINSFEERRNLIINKSKLSVAARNKIIKKHGSDYLSERTFNHDIALSQMYGPGFWDDIKDVVKPIATGALIAAAFFPPTAPFAVPVAASVATAGFAVKGVGHITDDKDWKEVGGDLIDIGGDSIGIYREAGKC